MKYVGALDSFWCERMMNLCDNLWMIITKNALVFFAKVSESNFLMTAYTYTKAYLAGASVVLLMSKIQGD